MSVTETGTRARQPDSAGFAKSQDGLRLHYEVFGAGPTTIVLLPANPISHSRLWKAQVPYLSRHFRVVVYDGRGNGLSDFPDPAGKWLGRTWADDCLTVMDATGTSAAVLVGECSDGVYPSVQIAVSHPDRVLGIVAIGTGIPPLADRPEARTPAFEAFHKVLDSYDGWFKFNANYMRQDYRGFLEFFFGQMFPEPHSTKQIEDAVAYALDGSVDVMLMDDADPVGPSREEAEALCRRVRCPVLVIQGDRDNCQGSARAEAFARLTGARYVKLEGSGHIPNARRPVLVNELIAEFAGEPSAPPPTRRSRQRPRALLVSSPIGLGHAWRDVAIARELRRQVPGLHVEWLAQAPLTTLLEACGETIHPASAELAPEAAHVDAESGEHELHAFNMLRRMDEILCANFMVFLDLVKQERFDVWIADEAWEIDHFLHEEPQLKTSPYVWMSDFVGYLPMPSGGEREACLTADYNAEVIEHLEKHLGLRDLSIFVGEPEDVTPHRFGPGLPLIPAWTKEHYQFAGYVLPFDPRDLADTASIRRQLGYDPARPLVVATVGGSGAGVQLLHRTADAFRLLREKVPDAELLLVCGPRIDPGAFAPVPGMRVEGYVHDLFRTLACCDLAVVQGGLSTTMELVANRRPFVYVPLRNHFEQNHHVAHRLRRHGAPPPTLYEESTAERLAAQMLRRLRAAVDYAPVKAGAAQRAASLIAPLIENR